MSSDTKKAPSTGYYVRPIVDGKVKSGALARERMLHGQSIGHLYVATEHEINEAFTKAQGAWEAFNGMGVVARCDLITNYLNTLRRKIDHFCTLYATEHHCSQEAAKQSIQDALAMAELQITHALSLFMDEMSMPGPTGETNDLYCAGRGVFLNITHPTASLAAQIGQLIALLLSGNTVILSSHLENDAFALYYWLTDMTIAAGFPSSLVHYLPVEASCDALLHTAHVLAGVTFAGPFEYAKALSQTLAARPGLLVPLITETDAAHCTLISDPHYPLRLIHERTRTINTAAIGGNASLLELSSE